MHLELWMRVGRLGAPSRDANGGNSVAFMTTILHSTFFPLVPRKEHIIEGNIAHAAILI